MSRVLGKTRFLWIHHVPFLPGPQNSPNTSKAVARGAWGNITSTLRARSRFPSVSLPPWCQKMLRHPAELQRKVARGGQRSKYTKCQYWNTDTRTKTQKQTCRELYGVFVMLCHSHRATCMICTFVSTLCTSGFILYVMHYTLREDLHPELQASSNISLPP